MAELKTALKPWEADDGDEGRRSRGQLIARTVKIKKVQGGYSIPSQSDNGYYLIWNSRALAEREGYRCSCPDYEKRQSPCKHLYAFKQQVLHEQDGRTVESVVPRPTYGQNWRAYDAAQQHEEEHFRHLLRELCDHVPDEPQAGPGRPRLPLGDMVYSIGTKVYSGMSSRRAMTQLREADDRGDLDKAPSYSSVCRYLENPALYEVLRHLILLSAFPISTLEEETSFGIDSTGFSSSVKENWNDVKWGRGGKAKLKQYTQWTKAHCASGVATNIVTALKVTHGHSADSPELPGLVRTTAEQFDVQEVSGDKAYASKANLEAIAEVGAKAFLMHKANARADQGHHVKNEIWKQSVMLFNNHREWWLEHYHKRSNVETTFAMVKAKFGAAVRSRTPVAQINETLVKFLCHNIVVLIQAMYELGIAPEFDRE